MKNIFWDFLDITRGDIKTSHAVPLILQLMAWKKLEGDPRAPGLVSIRQVLERPHLPGVTSAILAFLELAAKLEDESADFRDEMRAVERLSLHTVTHLLEEMDRLDLSVFSPDEFISFLNEARGAGLDGIVEAIPPDLADLMVELAELRAGQSVYVPFDFSFNVALKAALRGADVYAEFRNHEVVGLLHLMNILLGTHIKVKVSDPVRSPGWVDDGRLRQFDVAVSAPPFGLRYGEDMVVDRFDRFPEKTYYGEVLQLRHIQAQTRGRSVVLVPDGLLFRTRAGEREFKADLVEKGQVATVLSLPPGVLSNTGIATSLVILEPQRSPEPTFFVNATVGRFHEPGRMRGVVKLRNLEELVETTMRREESPYSVLVGPEEVARNDYNLLPDRYVLVGTRRQLEGVLAAAHTVPLEELADLIRPQALKAGEFEDVVAEFPEVAAQDIGDEGYIQPPAKRIGVGKKLLAKAKQQALKPQDVLLIIKGSVGRVAMVAPDLSEPWLANQSFVILRLRPNPHIDNPVVLMRYLASPIGQTLLSSLSGGTAIPMLQTKDVRALPVILPPAEEQAAVLETDRRLVELYQRVRELQAEATVLRSKHWSLEGK